MDCAIIIVDGIEYIVIQYNGELITKECVC